MTKRRYLKLILILGSLTALGPFTIDMYLPGFPAMAEDLNTDVAAIGLSLSSYFIGISVGQLLYGPLLDRYGRKRPLYAGLLLYIAASVACALAPDIDSLVAMRFVQAVGSCAAAVASVAMVRDLFPVEENAKVFGLLILVVGASPMIAPTVGGYVTAAWGWEPVFMILAGMGVIILCAVIFGLPESRQPDRSFSLMPASVLANFSAALRQPGFVAFAACGAVVLTGLLTYVSGSPQLFMQVFAVNETMYGWIFAILSIGLIGASQVNSALLNKYTSRQIIAVSLICQAVVAVALVAGTYFALLGIYSTIGLIFLYLSCTGLVLPNTSALAMAPFSENAGSASSLMGASQMGLGALATIGLSFFNDHSAVPMTLLMAVSAFAGLAIVYAAKKNKYEKDNY